MDSQGGLVIWVLGGAGVLFLYAAYSKQAPAAVLGKALGTAPAAPATPGPRESELLGPVPGSRGSTVVRSGTAYLLDGAGNPIGVVPAPYQNNPRTYIPGAVSV